MRYILLIILFSLIFVCCNQGQPIVLNDKESNSKIDTSIRQSNDNDTIGILVQTIDFKLKASKDELETFEDGVVPWISLDKPEKELNRLLNSSDIVLTCDKAILIIDYPLNKPASFVLTTTKGFSRKDLILEISKKYHEIYNEEETTSKIKTVPVDQRKQLLNRNETNGKYGIWGHDLSDLDLSAIEVHKNKEAEVYLILNVES